MENIGSYIAACKKTGLPDQYNFMTVDLWENKNMGQVCLNITSLKRHLGMGFEKASGPSVRIFSFTGTMSLTTPLLQEKQMSVLKDVVVPEQPRAITLPAEPKPVGPPVSPRYASRSSSSFDNADEK